MEGVEHGSTKRKIIFERPPIEPYKQPNNSRSSDKHLLKVLKTKYVTPSDKSFYHAAPTVWNELETLRSGCIVHRLRTADCIKCQNQPCMAA